jgi:hypothetical protein
MQNLRRPAFTPRANGLAASGYSARLAQARQMFNGFTREERRSGANAIAGGYDRRHHLPCLSFLT